MPETRWWFVCLIVFKNLLLQLKEVLTVQQFLP